ncbi:solute carrier organic anion transporter family member 4C1-like isoform X2 [Heterodontus francisci]|uniref:solute carrier organic anion transporter family member 4C1-like isoform X2 n=1 Tax=Heterodontus francisci TaxID=7792 RepID=UPI00355B3089
MDKGVSNPAFIAEDNLSVGQNSKSTTENIEAREVKTSEQEFEEGPCGWGTLTPNCLQHCNNPEGYLAFYSLLGIIQDTCALPNSNSSIPACIASASPKSTTFLFVFLLGQLLHGVGGTPLYTLGTAYIDDSVSNEKSSLYIGIGSGMSVLGPAFGYVLGGQLLDIYIDVNAVSKVSLMPDDPRWLGAWWIGFLFCWILAWCMVLPLSCFPKHLPGTAKVQLQKISQAHSYKSAKTYTRNNFGESFQDFFVVLLMMLRNVVFFSLTLASSTEALVITGFVTFMPKFIENQFGQTASLAATLGGAVLIPGAFIGQIVGGIIISKLKLQCRNMIKMAAATCVLSLLSSAVFIFAKCSNQPFAGVNQDYNYTSTAEKFELLAPCNDECRCTRSYFSPVCGVDNVQYFSACYAGCSNASVTGNTKVYQDCSCIQHVTDEFVAHEGKCGSTCTNMPIFMGFFLISVILTFMTSTPITTAVLRCVPDNQRSFSLGIQWVFVRLLGAIPGPILFGTVIDESCVLWNEDDCGGKGACWTYDNPKMAYMLTAIGASCKLISIVTLTAAYFLYRPPQNTEFTEQVANGPPDLWADEDQDQDFTMIDGEIASTRH